MVWKRKEKSFYRAGHIFSYVITKIIYRPIIVGKEHIPSSGRVIIAPNHRTLLDVPALGCATFRPMRFMAKKDLFNNPFIKWYFQTNGSFSIDKSESDPKAIKKAVSVLKDEDALVIFPEGRRIREKQLGDLLPGVGFLAVKGASPILPVAISHLDKIIVRKKWFIPVFTRARVVIGEPITSHINKEGKTSIIVQEVMDELKENLEQLYLKSCSM